MLIQTEQPGSQILSVQASLQFAIPEWNSWADMRVCVSEQQHQLSFFFFFFFFFFSSLLEVRRKMSFINPHAALWYTVLLFFESTPEYSIAVFFYM